MQRVLRNQSIRQQLIARRSALQLTLLVGAQLALAACSDGRDSPVVALPTAQQLCDEAVFRGTAPIADPDIQEISGIAASRRQPGVFWVHSDSGNAAEIVAIDAQGETLNRFRLPGVSNVDWEDIAIADDASGVAHLYIGDIGDNLQVRDRITVYRLPEPTVTGDGSTLDLTAVTAHHYTYPDAAHNAESLLVDTRDHRLYVVTKETDALAQTSRGPAGVYGAPADTAAGSTQVLSFAASIDFAALDSAGHAAYRDQVGITEAALPTAADFHSGSGVLGIRTYGSLWLWQVGAAQSVAAALQSPPCEARSRLELVGEAFGFSADGSGYVTIAELQPALASFARD